MSLKENGGHVPVSYNVDRQQKMVLTTWSGVVTEEEILAYQRQLRNDPDFDASFSQYSDLTDVREVSIEAIGTLLSAILARRGSQTAPSQVLIRS